MSLVLSLPLSIFDSSKLWRFCLLSYVYDIILIDSCGLRHACLLHVDWQSVCVGVRVGVCQLVCFTLGST